MHTYTYITLKTTASRWLINLCMNNVRSIVGTVVILHTSYTMPEVSPLTLILGAHDAVSFSASKEDASLPNSQPTLPIICLCLYYIPFR